MADDVKINIDGKILECPIIVGTEGEKAFDIAKLRLQTGFITMDQGFGNTGSCKSEKRKAESRKAETNSAV